MQTQARLHYLDNLRVFCMLFGILVQSNRLYDQGPWLIFPEISAFFRMASFFAISGFFAAMLYARWTPGRFFKHRLMAILVPLFFGLLVLNPITISLMTSFHDPAAETLGFMQALSGLWTERAGYSGPLAQVLQLWFLIALAVYLMLIPVFVPLVSGLGALSQRVLSGLPEKLWPLALSLALLVAVISARVAYEVFGPLFNDSLVFREVLMFLPYYVVGVAGYTFHRFWERLHVIDFRTIALGVALMVFYKVVFGDRLGPLTTIAEIAAYTVLTAAAVFALLYLFRKILDYETPTTRFLSDGIYPVYILQILLIYTIGHVMLSFGVAPQHMFWPAVVFTFFAGYAIHHLVIARVPLLTLLLKGRLQERMKPVGTAS